MEHSVQAYLNRQSTETLQLLLWMYSTGEEPLEADIRDEIFRILEARRADQANHCD